MKLVNIHLIEKIIDGDSAWVWLDLGFGLFIRREIRFLGIDAPEKNTEAGKKVKQFVEDWFKANKDCITLMIEEDSDKFGRTLGSFSNSQGTLNNLLIEKKLVKPFSGQEKRGWSSNELKSVSLILEGSQPKIE